MSRRKRAHCQEKSVVDQGDVSSIGDSRMLFHIFLLLIFPSPTPCHTVDCCKELNCILSSSLWEIIVDCWEHFPYILSFMYSKKDFNLFFEIHDQTWIATILPIRKSNHWMLTCAQICFILARGVFFISTLRWSIHHSLVSCIRIEQKLESQIVILNKMLWRKEYDEWRGLNPQTTFQETQCSSSRRTKILECVEM